MRLFGLIGNPLAHSRSQEYFRAKFKTDQLTGCDYHLFPLQTLEEFPELLKKNPLLEGVNVTIPYKESIIPYLDAISPEAAQIGAVNVVLIRRNGDTLHLEGHNTDASGFLMSLPERFTPRRGLVLGTGGAAKAVCFALNRKGIGCICVSRDPGREGSVTYPELEENFRELATDSIIVNTTPLGLFPDTGTCPPLPYELLDESMYLYDLIYNPPVTLFLKHAEKKDIPCQNGERMFLNQAQLSYQLFLQGKT